MLSESFDISAPAWAGATNKKGARKGCPPSAHDEPLGGLSGWSQRLLTFLPVARAKLVRLKGIEDTERFLRVAPDIEAVDRHMLDDIVGIDDEGGAIGDACVRSDDAERVGQFLLIVG